MDIVLIVLKHFEHRYLLKRLLFFADRPCMYS